MSVDQDITRLYQEVILDHNKNPKNFKKLEDASISQEGFNPVCGDHYHLYLKLDDEGTIEDITFEGEGCAISKASTSMMTQAIKGKSVVQAQDIFTEFQALLTKKLDPQQQSHNLGKLSIFSGIWKYPARVKCAGLGWHTLNAALEGKSEVVKTEE